MEIISMNLLPNSTMKYKDKYCDHFTRTEITPNYYYNIKNLVNFSSAVLLDSGIQPISEMSNTNSSSINSSCMQLIDRVGDITILGIQNMTQQMCGLVGT